MDGWFRFCRGLCQIYFRLFHNFRVAGLDNIPATGGFFIAANHESFFDPPAVGCEIERTLFFLARKTLFTPPIMDKILPSIRALPVDQEKPDMAGLKRIIDAAKRGDGVLLFPEGSRTLDGNPQPAAPGLGLAIARSGALVVPARIFGAYAAWPRNGRPRLFTPLTVVYGAPLSFANSPHLKTKNYQAISNEVMAAVTALTVKD
ncbi:MAG: 1-acyl-sn-glycerol-3-phosphate acyltransferase [Verrucomicrobiales bacterium]|jgi:1-acyl-sn-glycerol-3-phosphate acyltransferase|nr:1-acyl-sn-glycerol-3-phosphate acyltransferase [Verrucomicrobiales bacterium]